MIVYLIVGAIVCAIVGYFIWKTLQKRPLTSSSTQGPTSTYGATSTYASPKKYPPVALTHSAYPPESWPSIPLKNIFTVTGETYGNGEYEISQSSRPSNNIWLVSAALSGTGAFSSDSRYSGTSGAYEGSQTTTVGGAAVKGEYIQIKFPAALAVKQWTYTARAGNPASFVIAGSNDGVTWNEVYNQPTNVFAATPPPAGQTQTVTFNVNSMTPYVYYRMICLKTTGYPYWDSHGQTIYAV